MPKRYWGFIAAIIGIAAIYGFGLGYYHAALNYPYYEVQPQYRYAADKPSEIDPTRSAMPNAKPFEYRRPCDNPKGERESDLCAQLRAVKAGEDSALWAKWGVVISTIGSALLLWQIMLTRKAVEDTSLATDAMREANRIALNSQRPWLSLKPQGSAFIQFQTGDMPRVAILLPIIVENFGKSPAVQTYLKFGWKEGSYDSDIEINQIAASVKGKRISHDPPVFPGAPALIGQATWSSEIIFDGSMTQAELLRFVSAATLFVVIGYRSPDDSFFYTGDAFSLKGNGNLGTQFSFKLTRRIGHSKVS